MTLENVLKMNRITKRFGGNAVLEDVDFSLNKGEVHALLGANGAGKSTLMKILNGIYVSYEGEILLRGKTLKLSSPQDAAKKGISMIHQELELVDNLSIYRNVWLGQELKKAAVLEYKKMKLRTQEMLNELEFDLKADMLVSTLSTAQRQLVLIARAIAMDPDVIVMDEPTSSLSISEVDNLFRVIKMLKSRGISIIYISHYLEEIFRVADRVTVLRNGRNVTSANIEDCTQAKIVEWMIGNKNLGGSALKRERLSSGTAIEVKGLAQNKGIVHDVTFHIGKGEIVGLAGVVGSGRTETARIIFGIDKKARGTVTINGSTVHVPQHSPEKAARLKMGYIPEDRKSDGLLTTRSVMDNMSVVAMDKMRKNGIIQYKPLQAKVQALVEKLNIKCASTRQDAVSLSGGNQQKVVIGKWLAVEPTVLIMDQPTRGIDIGAKEEIYKLVSELAQNGMAILFISDELEEIMNLADRILVMKHGTIVAEYDNSGRMVTKAVLLGNMIGEKTGEEIRDI
jgi:ribose transport system ATP-binding protein